jgi:hypothetical protein
MIKRATTRGNREPPPVEKAKDPGPGSERLRLPRKSEEGPTKSLQSAEVIGDSSEGMKAPY